MSNFTTSPGVAISEIDNTYLTGQPVQAGAAIIGPTVKGPVEKPTLVTTYSDFVTMFGDTFISGGQSYSYLTSIAAYNYFNYGGTSLLVARVTSGSYSSAITKDINSGVALSFASASLNLTSAVTTGYTASFNGVNVILSGSSVQNVFNNATSSVVIPSNPSNFYTNTIINSSASFNTPNMIVTSNTPGITGNSYYYVSGATTVYYSGGSNGISFELETISEGNLMNNSGSNALGPNGALNSGSNDNVRWEVTNANTGSGTFNILVRRGNDIESSKVILEAWNNLTLDPNSSRYIAKVIGDQKLNYSSVNNQMEVSGSFPNNSKYIRVKAVNYPTPNYFNANGVAITAYTASIPLNGSGSNGGTFYNATGDVNSTINLYNAIAANTQGLIGTDYTNMIALLGNPEAYQFNVLFTPGLLNDTHTTQVTNIISNTIARGDNMYVLDLGVYGSNLPQAVTQAQTRDTSYAATYWPWVRIIDPSTGKHVWVPASTVIPGVYAFNDKVSAPWFAPAGINRGGLSTVLQAEYKLTQGNRDTLYSNNINPIATLPQQGVVVYGQKTLQKSQSALDRVNVRRLMIELKAYIRQIADTIVFEQNTIQTRNSFISRVNPYLEAIQQKQGLYAFRVVMDDSNNGPAVIDQNQLVGQIYIQPTRTAEFISLDFILQPTGAQFPI
jgi:phage tail sheath protein FI